MYRSSGPVFRSRPQSAPHRRYFKAQSPKSPEPDEYRRIKTDHRVAFIRLPPIRHPRGSEPQSGKRSSRLHSSYAPSFIRSLLVYNHFRTAGPREDLPSPQPRPEQFRTPPSSDDGSHPARPVFCPGRRSAEHPPRTRRNRDGTLRGYHPDNRTFNVPPGNRDRPIRLSSHATARHDTEGTPPSAGNSEALSNAFGPTPIIPDVSNRSTPQYDPERQTALRIEVRALPLPVPELFKKREDTLSHLFSAPVRILPPVPENNASTVPIRRPHSPFRPSPAPSPHDPRAEIRPSPIRFQPIPETVTDIKTPTSQPSPGLSVVDRPSTSVRLTPSLYEFRTMPRKYLYHCRSIKQP